LQSYGKNNLMTWVYLSPHYDDVAFSCGGLVWEQAQRGEKVEVWTVCSGEPPPGPLTPFAESLHARWGTPAGETVRQRAAEDAHAMHSLGARSRLLGIPDCVYRRLPNGAPVVQAEEDLWAPIQPGEAGLIEQLAVELSHSLADGTILVSPLTLGGHVDHRLVRAAAQVAAKQKTIELRYYLDYPYVIRPGSSPMDEETTEEQVFPVSPGGLSAWQQAVAAYTSQISSFWGSLEEMNEAIREYCECNGGVRLRVPCK
jgi:LmbE family N-acetylglucosaminyl deacetylase